MNAGEALATCSSAHLREDLNATWFAWEGFSVEQLPHRHRRRGTARALGATGVYGAPLRECSWHLNMLIAAFKGYDVSGSAKSYGHEKKRKVPALPRAYLLSNTRIKETSGTLGHTSHVGTRVVLVLWPVCVRVCVSHGLLLWVWHIPLLHLLHLTLVTPQPCQLLD